MNGFRLSKVPSTPWVRRPPLGGAGLAETGGAQAVSARRGSAVKPAGKEGLGMMYRTMSAKLRTASQIFAALTVPVMLGSVAVAQQAPAAKPKPAPAKPAPQPAAPAAPQQPAP